MPVKSKFYLLETRIFNEIYKCMHPKIRRSTNVLILTASFSTHFFRPYLHAKCNGLQPCLSWVLMADWSWSKMSPRISTRSPDSTNLWMAVPPSLGWIAQRWFAWVSEMEVNVSASSQIGFFKFRGSSIHLLDAYTEPEWRETMLSRRVGMLLWSTPSSGGEPISWELPGGSTVPLHNANKRTIVTSA